MYLETEMQGIDLDKQTGSLEVKFNPVSEMQGNKAPHEEWAAGGRKVYYLKKNMFDVTQGF